MSRQNKKAIRTYEGITIAKFRRVMGCKPEDKEKGTPHEPLGMLMFGYNKIPDHVAIDDIIITITGSACSALDHYSPREAKRIAYRRLFYEKDRQLNIAFEDLKRCDAMEILDALRLRSDDNVRLEHEYFHRGLWDSLDTEELKQKFAGAIRFIEGVYKERDEDEEPCVKEPEGKV